MKAARKAPRKLTSKLEVSSVSSLEGLAKIARSGTIVNVSSSGILLQIRREDIIPKALRATLTLDSLVGDHVMIHIDAMNLEISGYISRTKLMGKSGFELAINYADDAPEYWRECLVDLLPAPGEIED